MGAVEKDSNGNSYFESSYTCSSELKYGGVLLRYLGFLLAAKKNNDVKKMIGFICGSIPSLEYEDSRELHLKKKKRLIDYHKKFCQDVTNDTFTYHLNKVLDQIPKLFNK